MSPSAGGNQSTAHSALAGSCAEYLAWRSAWVLRVHGHLGQRPGVPDLLACLAGRLVAVECKTGRAHLSPAQCRERAALEAAGALFVECRSLEDLEEALLEAGLLETPALCPQRTPSVVEALL